MTLSGDEVREVAEAIKPVLCDRFRFMDFDAGAAEAMRADRKILARKIEALPVERCVPQVDGSELRQVLSATEFRNSVLALVKPGDES